jgi:hypothetical protein
MVVNNRLWDRVAVKENGCWEWTGAKAGGGYGCVRIMYHLFDVHRLSYSAVYDDDSTAKLNGYQIHHLCHNRACCNPSHLVRLTHQHHLKLRRRQKRAKKHFMPTCTRGHLLVPPNVIVSRQRSGMRRVCRTCRNKYQLARYHERRRQQAIVS